MASSCRRSSSSRNAARRSAHSACGARAAISWQSRSAVDSRPSAASRLHSPSPAQREGMQPSHQLH